jgi:sugar phosphate isomerase/epimerase
MTYDRRKFLKNTSLLATSFAIGGLACSDGTTTDADGADTTKTDTTASTTATAQPLTAFGLQLYTLREDLPKDPKGILKQISGFGYKQIEGFEGKDGLFWGMSHTDFKKYMDDLGMEFVSSHCNIEKDFEKKAAQGGEIGMKYLISPYIGAQKTIDDYKKYADKFNKLGDICKKNGLRFAYHNHGYTFEALDGQMPQDVLMQNTNPETVDYQMDIYWVVTPGADPVAWLQKYPNRFRLCHVKDRAKNATPKDHDASVDLGTGSIDFPPILKVAKANGMQYYIVEQEKYEGSTPIKSVETDAAYMKNLQI